MRYVTYVFDMYYYLLFFCEMLVSADLSKEQRAHIHQQAGRFKLKAISRNHEGKRLLSVTRMRSAKQLLEMLQAMGGENGKYKVVPPTIE